jgi:hypothetical protein
MLHQAIPLEVIDEPGDVPRRDLELVGQLVKLKLTIRRGPERKQRMETPLTQAMLLRPPIHELPA